MNLKTTVIISAALVALLSAPASARIDNEGGLSAYARFGQERQQMTKRDMRAASPRWDFRRWR